ncbi:MAG: ATP synthase F1 subunit gamma [Bacteroidales bacterium]|jgi:F-type H+-transporting ATPase subunit gamma|nr:ATP synthase F1 subunit gamma [Bacteroidales bacterium]
MASLKEVKTRINSVQSTRKVTSAMMMVSSAKLHKAQNLIGNMVPYQKRLDKIVANFLSGEISVKDNEGKVSKNDSSFESPFVAERAVKKIAVVAFSSNSSLCGSFNYNIVKEFTSAVLEYKGKDITVFPVGKKIEEAAKKMGFNVQSYIPKSTDSEPDVLLQTLAATPSYSGIAKLARKLMKMYAAGEADKVLVIYHHFKSTAVQKVERITYLPIDMSAYKSENGGAGENSAEGKSGDKRDGGYLNNYIVEPSAPELIAALIPQVLSQKLYTALADSYASEHAARTMAMQVATDNADDLIQELTLQYNKSRQQSITAELLDIIGGTMK